MEKITLEQRVIIIHKIRDKNHIIESSEEGVTYINSHKLSEQNIIKLGLFSLALAFMENKSPITIKMFAKKIDKKTPILNTYCNRVLTVAKKSNNFTENAIKEIIRITEELDHE